MGDYKFDTLKVRGGYNPKDHNDAVSVPIYATASYEIGSAERFDRIAAGEEVAHLYTRISNPTTTVLEERIAKLDGGVAAVAVASGMAAITYSLLAVAENGGRILTTHQLYGGTVDALKKLYPRFGIHIDKVSNDSTLSEFEEKITDDTRAIFVESISNPLGVVADIEELAKIAHKHNIPLIVDNTVATPYLLNPIKYGADIVVYSATKGTSGHGNAIVGVIVDSGNFNWDNGKFQTFTQREYTLSDINGNERSFVEAFGKAAFAAKVRLEYLGYFGAVLSPFDAYLSLVGVETISERINKQVANTEKILEFLENNEFVEWVGYPKAKNSKYNKLAEKYLPKGAGSIISFGFKGDDKQIYKVVNSVNLFSYQANLGDAKSLIINVPKTTHGELTPEELKLAEIPTNTIRLSLGLEDSEDLIEDLKQAFNKAKA